MIKRTIAAAVLVLLAVPAQAQQAPPKSTLAIDVRPVRNGAAEVGAIEFRAVIEGAIDPAKPLSFRAPIVYAGRTGIADRVDQLAVADAAGPVPIAIENDAPDKGGFPFYRHWRAQRPVTAPVVLTYRMMSFTGTATTGPQFDFYSHGGGISAGGMAIFVLPEDLGPQTLAVRWSLSDLGPGAIGASTYGAGDFTIEGPAERLAQAYYMAGVLGHFAPENESGRPTGFNAYWLGQPGFDPAKEMAWTYQSYRYLRDFYRDATTTRYTVLLRALPGTGGGTALQNSFMAGTAPGVPDPDKTGPRNMLFHEMGHFWVGGISGGSGLGGTAWFQEGLNVHYTRLLLLRSSLAPVADYFKDFDGSARNYYLNAYRNLSAAELSRLGFSTGVGAGSAQNVAYTRGSLFFADIDTKIRAASKGRRKLDDVILALFERRRANGQLSQDELIDAIAKEIGPAARKEFDSVIVKGETIIPAAAAFGPCFSQHPAIYTVKDARVQGVEWVLDPKVPDSICREW